MKKAAAILLFFLYVIPAVGINVSVHYCGGQISSVSLGLNNTDSCVCGSKKMDKSCCNDKQLSVKEESNHYKSSEVIFNAFKFLNTHPIIVAAYRFSFQSSDAEDTAYNDYHPPDKIKQPLYILQQVFRI